MVVTYNFGSPEMCQVILVRASLWFCNLIFNNISHLFECDLWTNMGNLLALQGCTDIPSLGNNLHRACICVPWIHTPILHLGQWLPLFLLLAPVMQV